MKTLIQLDIIQSAAVGAFALLIGMGLTKKVEFLRKFCVPSPVSGGVLFSVLSLILYSVFDIELSFDGTLKDVFMLIFFTSVGFQCDLKTMKKGGRTLLVMILLLAVLIALQNAIPVAITKAMGLSSLVGIATGSIPMTGGHGTAVGFTSVLEGMGMEGAGTISIAAATFGLIAGSMLGGPLAEYIVEKRLRGETTSASRQDIAPAMLGMESEELSPESRQERVSTNEKEFQLYARASYFMFLMMGVGTLVGMLLQKTGLTFPTYFGSLILAAIVRNVLEAMSGSSTVKSNKTLNAATERIVSIGNIFLSLFLGMAMVSLKLWELQSLALPLIIILAVQILLVAIFSYFIAFPLLGRDYDAAVLIAGLCGFGLGATPNAMANMSAVCYKYRYTVTPFLIVPIIGAMFADLINTAIITLFLNLL